MRLYVALVADEVVCSDGTSVQEAFPLPPQRLYIYYYWGSIPVVPLELTARLLPRVAPAGTGCIGCMSFPLDGPNGIVNKKGQWPDQYWLLSQTEGLYTYEDVKKSVTFDSENATLTHIVVSGRVRANLGVRPPPTPPLLPCWFSPRRSGGGGGEGGRGRERYAVWHSNHRVWYRVHVICPPPPTPTD